MAIGKKETEKTEEDLESSVERRILIQFPALSDFGVSYGHFHYYIYLLIGGPPLLLETSLG